MKKFHDPLDRVLSLRRAQGALEESKLQALQLELRSTDSRAREIQAQSSAAAREIAAHGASGLELASLASYRRAAEDELARLAAARQDCERRLAAQLQTVRERRREAKLLERLKERRLAAWNAAYSRELEREAAEAYLSRWNVSA
jgi:flagellar export protein FliJ